MQNHKFLFIACNKPPIIMICIKPIGKLSQLGYTVPLGVYTDRYKLNNTIIFTKESCSLFILRARPGHTLGQCEKKSQLLKFAVNIEEACWPNWFVKFIFLMGCQMVSVVIFPLFHLPLHYHKNIYEAFE